MTWLITGGCGFVGSNLADALLSNGQEVVVLDNLSRFGSRDNLNWLRSRHGAEWQFVESDIRNEDAVAHLMAETKPHALAHLAGQVAMTTSLQSPRLDFEVNALGTLNVLEAVRLQAPETIILYSSTNKVYGDLDWVRHEEHTTRYRAADYPNGFSENIPLAFSSPYGCSKGSADQYVLDYARMFDLRTVVFRHSSMYGGRQFATFDQGWIGWFCKKALEAKDAQLKNLPSPTFTISGNGKQVRDVLHAEDIISLYFSSVENIDAASGNVFNIGGGMSNSLSLIELFSFLENELGISLAFERLPWRASDQKVFVADIEKARRMLHWLPQVQASTGIKRVVNWLQENTQSD